MTPDLRFSRSNTCFFSFLAIFFCKLKRQHCTDEHKILLTCTLYRIKSGVGARRVINNTGMVAELMEAEHEAGKDLRQFAQPLNHRAVL